VFNENNLFIKNILELFIKQYPKDLNLLKAAITNKSIVDIKSKAHHLKSTVTSVNEFAPQLKELEILEALESNYTNWAQIDMHFNILEKAKEQSLSEAENILQTII
jgi:HPt (histidine-containing phosphotransfer) domain-containing protein